MKYKVIKVVACPHTCYAIGPILGVFGEINSAYRKVEYINTVILHFDYERSECRYEVVEVK